MIIIKTDMEEMPKGCAKCDYNLWYKYIRKFGAIVGIEKKEVPTCKISKTDESTENHQNKRPCWCQLEEEIKDV